MPMNYAHLRIQCTAPDGRTGTFLINKEANHLISPVCRDLVELSKWMNVHGWRPLTQDLSDLRHEYIGHPVIE